MTETKDFSFLNKLQILEIIFPVVYSPFDFESSRSDSLSAVTHFIEVEKGIKIGCKYFSADKDYPSILYFHGNGETVLDQDWIAPSYNIRGINLFMTDYRGYGVSDGKPTVDNLIGDSPKIFKNFKEILKKEGYNQDIFVMGRSLGSIPAIETAYQFNNELKGLIIESGTSGNFPFLEIYLSPEERHNLKGLFKNKEKIRAIKIPTLIIHGELDEILPVREGKELFEYSGSVDKSILIIPGSGHNDLLFNGENPYFSVLGDFVNKYA
jgi:alpha-beta hydrolase superfamily lysophospholipase